MKPLERTDRPGGDVQRIMDEWGTRVDHALNRLGFFYDVLLGDGHGHAQDLAELVKIYPFIARDPSHVHFLATYGGATLSRDRDAFSVGLYGTDSDASLHLAHGPGDPVDGGFLWCGDIALPEDPGKPFGSVIGLGLGIDATEEIPGIFLNGRRFSANFAELLEVLADPMADQIVRLTHLRANP
ncbi:hypothetical protein ACTG9Q_15455 [Actinokineospora sp. 24-640]